MSLAGAFEPDGVRTNIGWGSFRAMKSCEAARRILGRAIHDSTPHWAASPALTEPIVGLVMAGMAILGAVGRYLGRSATKVCGSRLVHGPQSCVLLTAC
jgi:hypothetical protein